MMSSRLNTSTITAAAEDFPYTPMQPYVGFDHGVLANERPAGLLPHHLYDNLDFASAAAAAAFDSPLLPVPSNGLPLTPPPMLTPMPSASFQMPLPGMAEVYPFGLVKREEGSFDVAGCGGEGGRIGLNLGRRTYFSPADVLAVDRLLMRSRFGGVLGLGLGGVHQHHHQPPRCQAEGCKADLSGAKHYHRRHKVCEYHAKATAVIAGGKQQRFCQQCSRFHVLSEFDEAKRSCRKRLTEHNRRRRKPMSAAEKGSPPPSKKADTASIASSYTSDHKATSTAKSTTTISPDACSLSCMDRQSKTTPTLSLAAAAAVLQQEKQSFDTLFQDRHEHYITSLVQHQQQHNSSRNNNNDHILSCSSVSSTAAALQHNGEVSHHQNSNSSNMHFFEDFI